MTNQAARVLLAEDEVNLARGIRENLEAEGYWVEVVGDGVTTLDTRDVFFLVPPEPIDEPIG